MKNHAPLTLAFVASLLTASSGVAETTVYTDSFNTINLGWTAISGSSQFTSVPEPGKPANNVLQISTVSSASFIDGRSLSISATNPCTVAINFGVKASNFDSFADMINGEASNSYDIGFSIVAGGHTVLLSLDTVYENQAMPYRLQWHASIGGNVYSSALCSMSYSDFVSQGQQYDPDAILWNIAAISDDGCGN